MSDIAAVFRRADALLANKDAWTRGEYALDTMGYPTHPANPNAACYCLEGAIVAAVDRLGLFEFDPDDVANYDGVGGVDGPDPWSWLIDDGIGGERIEAILVDATRSVTDYDNPYVANDGADFATVKAILARAIELADGEQAATGHITQGGVP